MAVRRRQLLGAALSVSLGLVIAADARAGFVLAWLALSLLAIVWSRRRIPYSSVTVLLLLALLVRLAVAILQAELAPFVTNADSAVYASRGMEVSFLGFDRSYALGYFLPGQRGITLVNAAIASLSGHVPTAIAAALVGAGASAVALVLTLDTAAALLGKFRSRVPDHIVSDRSWWVTLAAVLALSPSLAFWGSLNLKEPYVTLGVTLVGWSLVRSGPSRIIALALGVLVCLLFRPYVGFLVLAVVLSAHAGARLWRRGRRSILVISGALLVTLAITQGARVATVDLQQQRLNSIQAGGTSLTDRSQAGPSALAAAAGKVVFPLPPWQPPTSPLEVIAYFESLAIGGAFVLLLWDVTRRRVVVDSVLAYYLLVCFTLVGIIYAYGITNAGTLMRLRSPFFIATMPMLCWNAYVHLLNRRIRRYKAGATALSMTIVRSRNPVALPAHEDGGSHA